MSTFSDTVLQRLSGIEGQVVNNGSSLDNIEGILNTLNQNTVAFAELVRNGFTSQSHAQDTQSANRVNSNNPGSGPFGQHHANNYGNNGRAGKKFLDEFERSLIDALGGSQFKAGLRNAVNKFADQLGVSVEDLQGELGDALGKTIGKDIANSKLGKKLDIEGKLGKLVEKVFNEDNIQGVSDIIGKMKAGELDMGQAFEQFGGVLGNISPKLGTFAGGVGKAVGAINNLTGGIGGTLAVILIAKKIVSTAAEGFKTTVEGFSDLFNTLKEAGNRYTKSREKNQELANKRLEEDVRTMIETPFKILEKAANEVYDAWNANIRLIAGTQGYDKADLQDLMSEFARRLTKEGLGNTIPATDVYNNLANVIQAGLTGNGAVEFAYQATKLNAAVPNQDFFAYVNSYASVAANAIAAGKSESEALQIATESLEQFANSLLYADRNLTNGYSTSLTAAEGIYNSAVKIAQAAKSDNISKIADTLLAIQGYVGAIAPDLASSLSDKIYQLATGGNSSDIVALRSLAGINASNTEFLRALAENPQSVISTMFANLGKMYTQSPDAYMEKAEGYAALFGMSSEAFQRVDFMELAASVGNMDNHTKTLEENMKQLRKGQTTTSQDQLKIAQINKYMIEEGLAYVIDNEAAQMIQQHMWDEQLARQMMEAEYGVNLVGGAASALQKIVSGIDKILSIINPIAWISKIAKTVETVAEANQLQADIKGLLEAGVVGKGRSEDLYNLTARNTDLQLTRNLVDMMGGQGKYGNSSGFWKGLSEGIEDWAHPLEYLVDVLREDMYSSRVNSNGYSHSSGTFGSKSNYSGFGSTSKGLASIASAALNMNKEIEVSQEVVHQATEAVSASLATTQARLDQMMADEYIIEQYVKKGKSYEEWLESGKDLGIVDMQQAMLESGYKSDDVEEYFKAKQTEAGMAEKLDEANRQKLFQDTGTQFWATRFWNEYVTPLQSKMDVVVENIQALLTHQQGWSTTQFGQLTAIMDGQTAWRSLYQESWLDGRWVEFSEMFTTTYVEPFIGKEGLLTRLLDEFTKVFVEHVYYNDAAKVNYESIASVQRRETEEKNAGIYALAEALTGNLVDLKNPQVQTNSILAQILLVVTAIMNQNNGVAGTVSLSDALTSLALGLTNTTPIDETPVS